MKWCGSIGFSATIENPPYSGIYEPGITERKYYGDVIRKSRSLVSSDVIDDISISNTISIVADSYARENAGTMCYAVIEGSKWKIKSIDASTYPRLTLTLGELYNE